MKKFANAEIEVVKFDNAVIATSGCTDITKAKNYDGEIESNIGSMYYSFYGMSFAEYLTETGRYYSAADNYIWREGR